MIELPNLIENFNNRFNQAKGKKKSVNLKTECFKLSSQRNRKKKKN